MIPAVLLLGDRSPYGLSVARALLQPEGASRIVRVTAVVCPTAQGWALVAERAARAAPSRPLAGRALRRLQGAARRAASLLKPHPAAAAVEETGHPLPDMTLDPGIDAASLEAACLASGVDWRRVDTAGSAQLQEILRHHRPRLVLSAAFPFILPASVLSIPPEGAINFHPSLLPRCRGSHPIFWTLASGEAQGGVTAHWMTSEVDAGDIVAQIPLPLTDDDTYVSLYRRAMAASGRLVEMVERFLATAPRQAIPQDSARASIFREDTDEDHHIDWAGRSPARIADLVRTGMAWSVLRGERLGILSAREHRPSGRDAGLSSPGSISAVHDDVIVVEAAGGALAVATVSWRGRSHRAGDLARALGVERHETLA